MGGRFAVLIFSVFLAYAYLLFRLYDVQITNGEVYRAQAQSQFAALDPEAGRRGTIYFADRDGGRSPAALNKNFPIIYGAPSEVSDLAETAARAAALLGKPASELLPIFSRKNSSYAVLDKNPSPELAAKVKQADIDGLSVKETPRRFYPLGTLGAQVLGFFGPNDGDNSWSGKYGAEKFWNDELSGRTPSIGRFFNGASGGEDVVLTIDPEIQKEGEHIIRDLVNDWRAKSGSFIVMDPKTGALLGMGGYPSFDPNSYGNSETRRFMNPLIEQVYEPGSVFKVLTMAAGIDSGAITPKTTFYDSGELKLNGRTIKNWDLKAHGTVTMTQVIEGSINTGAAFAERETGHKVFREYLEKFGFGKETGITLPGELSGDLSTLRDGEADVNFATASFGQGVAVTPLQMIRAIAAIANGGKLLKPLLAADDAPEVERQVISFETAKQVTAMMVSAVDKAGVAAISGYAVAGKTGTAQVPDFVNGGYTSNVIDTYIGFAPASDPRFIVLVKIVEPAGAPHAAETVVPAFRKLAQYLLNYFAVTPDRINP